MAGVMTSTTGLGGWGFLLLGGSIAGKPKLAVALKAGSKRGSILLKRAVGWVFLKHLQLAKSLSSLFTIGFDRESASFSEAQYSQLISTDHMTFAVAALSLR